MRNSKICKCERKQISKEESKVYPQYGITLIALIITIVVMLILAGVTINLTLGENGIFTTAQKAAKNYTDAQNKEMADLGDFTNLINETINGISQSGSTGGTETPEVKVTEISLNKTSTTIAVNGTETLTATVIPDNASNKNVTWSSSDETVATVLNGTITAIKPGNTTITATAQDGSGISANCELIVTNPTLTSKITGADYGKSIDYSVTVKNSSNEDVTLSNWRVFYNDKTTNNVYIIYGDYLENSLIPTEVGMTRTGTYRVHWENVTTNTDAVATLKNTTYWTAFAGGTTGATAYGGPTKAMFINSWNENPAVNSTVLTPESEISNLTDSSQLYIPRTQEVDGCTGYWLASISDKLEGGIWRANYNGGVNSYRFGTASNCVRPLVCLPSAVTGIVGTSVSIDN